MTYIKKAILKGIGLLLSILLGSVACAQNITLEILDLSSKKPVEGAVVQTNISKYLITDKQGVVSFSSDKDIIISISILGYLTVEDTILVKTTEAPILRQYFLVQEDLIIDEIEITDSRDKNPINSIGEANISKADILNAPSILGEADIVQAIRLEAGVQSGGEASSGYYVRGGSVDQNMVLLDKAPIFNPSHLFGFFSVFNPFTVGNANFKKSGFTANQGGRVSSFLDVEIKRPSLKKLGGQFKISTLASAVQFETPVIKDRVGITVAARRTYIDKLTKILLPEDSDIRNRTDLFFYDGNIKLFVRPSDKDALTATSFLGRDGFNFAADNGFSNVIRWQNRLQSLSYYRQWSDKISHDLNFHYTQYDVDYKANISNYLINIFSSIEELGGNASINFDQVVRNHSAKLGYELKRYEFVPNTFNINANDVELNTLDAEVLNAREAAISFQDQYAINDQFQLNLGFRQSFYSFTGPFDRFNTDDNLLVTDTVSYKKGETIQSYSLSEPRLSFVYNPEKNLSLKIAYDRMAQYVHLAPISSVSLPTDVWVPSSNNIEPQKGNQISLEVSKNVPGKNMSYTFATYYKKVNDVVEYQNAILLGYGTSGFNYDDNFISGVSESRGIEFSGAKKWRSLETELTYTLSKTDRQFDELNESLTFPAKYDSRHNGNARFSYQLSKSTSISAIFNFSSGNAITIPVGRYVIEGNVISDYAGRNNFRLPNYHRLDLSLDIKNKKRGVWNVSIYNAYNRKNPYFVFFDVEGNLEEYQLSIDLTQVSLFPILPGISYTTYF